MTQRRLSNLSTVVSSLLIGLTSSCLALAQQDIPAELKSAIKAIDQATVTSTVTFLSSDEMAGRDTPSPELTIATSYVAARFRGAGLKGFGEDGSYFQNNEIDTIAIPDEGIVIEQDGVAVPHFGMLSAGSSEFTFQGKVQLVTKDSPSDAKFSGPVSIVADKFESRRDQSNLMRRMARLRQNGATAILIQVEPDHGLVAQATAAKRPQMASRRGGGSSGPALLIAKTKLGGELRIDLPKQSEGKAVVRNVIGMIPGSDPNLSKEAIIISAHLDHIGQRGTIGDTICNGADDNASGVTGVVSLADAFAAMPVAPKRTVIFMTFWGEEKGLLGSRYYVENPIWPLEKTVANVNIEMIGRPEPGAAGKCWGTGWDKSDLCELMSVGAKKAGVLIFQHPNFSGDMLYRASDNFPFVSKGVVAHSFSAGSLHEDYHQPGDEWEKLELKHMTKVIQGLFAGVLPIAKGEVTPKKN